MSSYPIPSDPVALLEVAELQYKFAISISAAVHTSDELLTHGLALFTWGTHRLDDGDLILSKEQEKLAAVVVEHASTYVMAVQLDTAMQAVVPNRFKHPDPAIQAAAWIAQLIRNAFAHDPLNPKWLIKREAANRTFEVPGILALVTRGLQDQPVRREDYGGSIALLRLLQFVRQWLAQGSPGAGAAT